MVKFCRILQIPNDAEKQIEKRSYLLELIKNSVFKPTNCKSGGVCLNDQLTFNDNVNAINKKYVMQNRYIEDISYTR